VSRVQSGLDADVIVAGAGPAGSTAALVLARAGRRVILCDRAAFPRDKTCGDGLIADSIGALEQLGLDDEVAARAERASALRIFSPRGTQVQFETTFWVLPRRVFDRVLYARAIEAGAEFRQLVVEGPLIDDGRIVGVAARLPKSETRVELRAPLTLLATGASAAVLRKFEPTARASASGYAIRTYAEGVRPLSELVISLDRDLLPGYAWAFPEPGGAINVGIGVLRAQRLREDAINLRHRLDDLVAGRGMLGEYLGPLRVAEPYQGAPLRTGLMGAQLHRPGLAIIGEAAGTTYALTGEGIGKAMESGIVAAGAAIAAGPALADIGATYAHTMRTRYAGRFETYETAQRWMRFPFVADYIAARANRSRWLHERLTGILTERALPTHVFSVRTFWRLLTHG
jgi:geranylgeranyl reductase family protein